MTGKPAILGNAPIFDSLIPLVRPSLPKLGDSISAQVAEILETGMLTKGKHLYQFETRTAEYLHVKHAIAVSSCTLGLFLTYHGLGLTGEVIVPSFTFMATVHPLHWVGAQPVFVDIDPHTWNVDPAQVEAAITERTVGIVAVHNFGNPANIEELEVIARRHNVKLVFDAAHGFGSLYHFGPVGGHGAAEVFSLSPTKLLIAGEGGIVATNDDRLADHIRVGREYGNPGDYGSDFPGLNARMPEFSALLGVHSLEMLEEAALHRNRVAGMFRSRLGELTGITFQSVRPDDRSSYKDFSIVIDPVGFGLTRDETAKALREERVDTRQYHDPPVHTHKAYFHLADLYRGALPVTDDIASKSLSLPIWSHMDFETVDGICMAIERIHRYAKDIKSLIATGGAADGVVPSHGDRA